MLTVATHGSPQMKDRDTINRLPLPFPTLFRETSRMIRRFHLLFFALALSGAARGQTPQTAPPAQAGSPDFNQLSQEAMGWLQDLVRIDTTNPPGNELVAAKYVAAILTKEGIPSEIFESTPGRGFIVARLSASAVPDPSRALLLMAHLDVVGVD